MSKRKNIAFTLAVSAIAVFAILIFFEFGGRNYQGGENFTVSRGQNLFQIANNLKAQGYIKSKILFAGSVILSGNSKKFKAGIYDLRGASESEIIKKLVLAQTVPVEFTVIPGQTIGDIAKNISAGGLAGRQDFLNGAAAFGAADFAENGAGKFDFLNDLPQGAGLEGFLYPDTYQIDKEAGAKEIIRRMLENFDRKLSADLREDIKKQGKTVFEIVTMASLLEKEVKSFADRQLVAGILWKRQKEGMLLQVDSTLLYFLVSNHPDVTDKDADSRFNTYKYAGLPKGPICNPDLDSIKAAIYPEESKYWYYLSAKDGTTIFSKNYSEHLINKAKYLD